MTQSSWRRLAALVGAALLAAAGTGAPHLAAQPPAVVVDMRDFAFEPRDLAIAAGTAVRWVNRDATPHSIVMEGGRPGGSRGTIAPGAEHTFVFREAGRYVYRCGVHPTMLGEVHAVP
jgi:plastocyanin